MGGFLFDELLLQQREEGRREREVSTFSQHNNGRLREMEGDGGRWREMEGDGGRQREMEGDRGRWREG